MITANRKSTKSKTKAVAKKTTSRAAKPASRSARAAKAAKPTSKTAIRATWTKSQILSGIADNADLTKKQVSAVFCELEAIICQHLKKGNAGEFVLPGLLKIMTKHKPATKARKGINPFTGETTTFKARPARNVIKIRALKKLKDMV